MRSVIDALWRAAAYCLHPRVVLYSLAPLVLMAGLTLGLGYFFWEPALDAVSGTIERWSLLSAFATWLESIGLSNLRTVLPPLIVVALATPLIVVVSLLLVAAFMTPAMVELVAARRFPLLEKKRGGSIAGSIVGSLWTTIAALVALAVSVPLWLIPPLVLVLPPLIWGWLTYRLMGYDVLADHASAEERRVLLRRHRTTLLAMGVITGYLGAAPSLLWASGALFLVFAPVLVPVAVWIYTLIFAFSSLWFAHYLLAALQAMRRAAGGDELLPPAARPFGGPPPTMVEEARLIERPTPSADRPPLPTEPRLP